MTTAVLKFISDAMASAGIPYEFMEYTSAVNSVSSYWVGEYSEVEPITEDGLQEPQFILNGFGRGSWLKLEQQKKKLKSYSPLLGAGQQFLTMDQGLLFFMEMHFRFRQVMDF